LQATALSFFIILPFQAFVSICFVRRHVPVEWLDLVRATWKSAVIAAASAAGPLAVVASAGFRFDLSLPLGFLAGTLAALGWLAGVWFTRHPVLIEVDLLRRALQRLARSQRRASGCTSRRL
jgi:hypothetical protein